MARKRISVAAFDGSGRRRSLWWRFKAKDSDFYVGCQGMGQFKASFHGDSGYCAWAYTKEYFAAARALIDRDTRVSDSWYRPECTPEAPVHQVAVISIPGEDPALDALGTPPPDERLPDYCLSAAAHGHTRQLHVLFGRIEPAKLEFEAGFETVSTFALANGEFVYLTTVAVPFTWKGAMLPAEPATPHGSLLAPVPVWPNRMRATLHAEVDPSNNIRFVFDVPIYPDDLVKALGVETRKLFELPQPGPGSG